MYAPGNRAAARSATSSLVASSRSIRASSRSRWFLRGGKPSRSRVDEGRRRRRPRLEQRGVGEPGKRRVEAVHDVEVAAAERGRDVRADADGEPDRGARGDRDGARDRDDPLELARLERAAPGEEVGRAGRRREHHDDMPTRAQRVRDPGDVLVRVVWHRPRMGRHEADAKRHGPRL